MKYLWTLLIAAVPVIEVRGAVPYAVANGIGFPWAILLPMFGNISVVPLILVFLEPVFRWIKHRPSLIKLSDLVDRFEAHALKKAGRMQTLEMIGLMLFVGIPLPGTGAWTGALIAVVLKFPKWKSFLAISAGVLIASVLVYLASIGVIKMFF